MYECYFIILNGQPYKVHDGTLNVLVHSAYVSLAKGTIAK